MASPYIIVGGKLEHKYNLDKKRSNSDYQKFLIVSDSVRQQH